MSDFRKRMEAILKAWFNGLERGWNERRRWKKIMRCSSNSTGSMGMWYSNMSFSRTVKSAISFAIVERVASSEVDREGAVG